MDITIDKITPVIGEIDDIQHSIAPIVAEIVTLQKQTIPSLIGEIDRLQKKAIPAVLSEVNAQIWIKGAKKMTEKW